MPEKRDRNIPPGVLNEARRTIVNKVTGETVVFHKYGHETKGEYAEVTIDCLPGGGPPLHYHTSYNERFEGLEGEATVYAGGLDNPVIVKPGDVVFVPMGMNHRFTSKKDTVKIKGQVLPAHSGFERSLYILFGLNEDSLTDKEGMPKSLVHTAIISEMSDMKFPGIGGVFMNTLLMALAWYGRWSGEEEKLLRTYWD